MTPPRPLRPARTRSALEGGRARRALGAGTSQRSRPRSFIWPGFRVTSESFEMIESTPASTTRSRGPRSTNPSGAGSRTRTCSIRSLSSSDTMPIETRAIRRRQTPRTTGPMREDTSFGRDGMNMVDQPTASSHQAPALRNGVDGKSLTAKNNARQPMSPPSTASVRCATKLHAPGGES